MQNRKSYLYEGFSHRYSPKRILCLFIDYVDDSILGLFLYNVTIRYKEYKKRNDSFVEQIEKL